MKSLRIICPNGHLGFAPVERLNREINAISASPELRVFFDPDGAQPAALPGQGERGGKNCAQKKRAKSLRAFEPSAEFL